MVIKIINFLTLASVFFSTMHAGVDFAAIVLPKKVNKDIAQLQSCVKKCAEGDLVFDISPQENLHITLKEIADLTDEQRTHVNKALKKVAQKFFEHNIAKSIKKGHLHINATSGLAKWILSESTWLNNLAHKIEEAVFKLQRKKKIGAVTHRMDFPQAGHITLGYIKPKKEKDSLENYKKFFKKLSQEHKLNPKECVIKKFVLLKSNRPQTPRVYTVKGQFELKEQKKDEKIITKV